MAKTSHKGTIRRRTKGEEKVEVKEEGSSRERDDQVVESFMRIVW